MNSKLSRSFFLFSTLVAIAAMSGCSSSTSPSSSGDGGNGGGGLVVTASVNFGVRPNGLMLDTTINISNGGSDSVTITGDGLSSTAGRDTNFLHPVSIAPLQNKSFHFQFTPSASVSSATDSIHYQVSGKNYTALMTFTANGSGGTTGTGSLVAVPPNINFGSLTIGQWHDTTILLFNNGSAPLTITSDGLSSTEARDTNFSSPAQIAPQSDISIHLQFNPSAAGVQTATDLIHYTSGGVTGVATITLSATGAAGVTSTSPKAGSTFTYAVDTNGVAQGDSTYTVVSNSLSFQGKTNVLEVSGPTGDLNYYHIESNGDVSVYLDLSAYSAELISAGIVGNIPSTWVTIPLGSKQANQSVLFDSTLSLDGFPVSVIITDSGRFIGSSSITAAGKAFQATEGSMSLAINATVEGLITVFSADNQTEIWY